MHNMRYCECRKLQIDNKYATVHPVLLSNQIHTEELILPDNLNEELYAQHKKQAEKSLKKLVVVLAALFLLIVIASFFV